MNTLWFQKGGSGCETARKTSHWITAYLTRIELLDISVFVINLDRSAERFETATKELKKLNLKPERIAAVDGSKLDRSQIPDYDEAKSISWFGRPLAAGEIGCSLSHINALKRFLESDAPYALVLEDDIAVDDENAPIWNALIENLEREEIQDWWLINVGRAPRKMYSKAMVLSPHTPSRVYKAHYYSFGTHALLWSRQGAEAALKNCLPIQSPFDIALRDWNFRDDFCYALQHAPFSVSGAASEIDETHTTPTSRDKRENIFARNRRRVVGQYSMIANILRYRFF